MVHRLNDHQIRNLKVCEKENRNYLVYILKQQK